MPAAREAFLAFWREHGATHFRVEEDVLLPAFADHGDPDEACVVRMLVDHVRIRAAARRLEDEREPSLESLHELGTALERHVRLEEREVFPLIEAVMPEAAAEALAEAVMQAERAPARPPAGPSARQGRPPPSAPAERTRAHSLRSPT